MDSYPKRFSISHKMAENTYPVCSESGKKAYVDREGTFAWQHE
ncbi:hypothetical protein ACUXCC_005127 [Cytobacillus horneckiae]